MDRRHLLTALAAGSIAFVFHLAANPHYGFFRDELYFIICGLHPQWGYVDQPPITPLLAAGSQIFGHSLFLLRAVCAAFAGASVYVICLLAFELGGGTFAAILAALCGTLCPVLAAFAMKVGPDMVGLWLWPLAALYLIRMANGGDPRRWLGAGAAIGVSAESKYSVLYFAAASLLGLLLTPERTLLRSRWFAAGAALAVVIALPNFLWQALNGFPMWELLRNGQLGKNVVLSPPAYLLAEIIITNPVFALVWLSGLAWTLANARIRFLGFGYVLLLIAMIASHAKHYYPADVYPVFFAAGGVAIESWTRRAPVLRPAAFVAAFLAGIALLPYVEPILPEKTFISFNKAVGPKLGMGVTVTEHLKQTWMTQDWADMHGWPQLAATVQRVYDALPPAERSHAVVFAQNYGEASAIAFFTNIPVISGHNQYYLWGTRGTDAGVMIDINGACWQSLHLYRSAKIATTFSNPYGMPYEDGMPIAVCRGINQPIAKLWPRAKHYE